MSKVKQVFSNRSWKIIGALQVFALLLAIVIGSWSVAAAVVVISIGLAGGYITGHPRLGKLLSPPQDEKWVKIVPLADPRTQGFNKKPSSNLSRRAVLQKTATLTSIAVAGAVVAVPSSGLWNATAGFYSGNLTRSIRNGDSGLGSAALETFIAESYDSLPGPFNPENIEADTIFESLEPAFFNTETGLAVHLPHPLSNGLRPFKAGSKPGTLYIPTNEFSAQANLGFHGRARVQVEGNTLEFGAKVDESTRNLDLWLVSRPTDVNLILEGARAATVELELDPGFIERAIFSGATPSRGMVPAAAFAVAFSLGPAVVHAIKAPAEDQPSSPKLGR